MTIEQATRIVQMAYPQVYLACHTRHLRKQSTEHRLSARDAAILAHLDDGRAITPHQLAVHLSIAASTLSEALKRLESLGYVGRPQTGRGAVRGRRTGVLLTARGAQAIRDTSVLETERLRAVLARISDRDRQAIARGLERLARACRAAAAGPIAP
jgi:MarR family transcriptional regulator, organic hydroperoxide resistance regulator